MDGVMIWNDNCGKEMRDLVWKEIGKKYVLVWIKGGVKI